MNAIDAICTGCGEAYALTRISRCTRCHFPLDVRYDYGRVPRSAFDPAAGTRADGIWVHRAVLPLSAATPPVTLGEGHTPLLSCARLGERLGLSALWIKDETRQPTGSFKDRPLSVAVSKAREFGAEIVVTASSGNAAAAMASYAARAGLRSVVLIPGDTPASKLLQILAAGALVVRVTGPFSECARLAKIAASQFGWYDVSTTFANPYSVEGNKTAAYEIAAALKWRAPSWIAVPVGSGPLLVGMWKGFVEMQRAGLVSSVPRFIAAQAAGCAPIARAFEARTESVQPWESPRTVASGIRDGLGGYAEDGSLTLRIACASGGCATAASDQQILDQVLAMNETEGLYGEPTVGAAVAGVGALVEARVIKDSEDVVIMSTGHGLKQPFVDPDIAAGVPEIPPAIEALRRAVDRGEPIRASHTGGSG